MTNINLVEELQKAKSKWQSKDYSSNEQKHFLEARRDNEIASIDDVIFRIKHALIISETTKSFALKLIKGAERL